MLVAAGVVLLMAAGGVSAADCGAGTGNACQCGDTVVGDWTFTGNMVCTDGTKPGLIVGASDITIDGAGYSMTGAKSGSACNVGILGASPSEQNPAKHSGIVNNGDFDNVVIKDLEIKNFCTGIAFGDMIHDSVDNNAVTGCNIHGCGASGAVTHGIHMVHTNDCPIEENEIYNIDGTGVDGGCSGGGNGIFMYGEVTTERGWYNNIINNYLHDNTKSGFFMKHQCMHCTISYNKATNNGEGGIVPMCAMSSYNYIEYNDMSNNVRWGFMSAGDNNTIRYNTANDNGEYGIYIGSAGAGPGKWNTITDNTACGNGDTDIMEDSGAGPDFADSNTCDTSNIPGACDWSCGGDPQLCTNPDPPSHNFGSVPEGETRIWTFEITNCGEGTLEWTVSDNRPWITVSPASGSTTTETDTVTVTIDTTGLTTGATHEGTVTVGSNDGTKTGTISVSIPLGQEDPLLCTSPDPPSHNFGNVQQGQTRTWTFEITNCGGGTLTWTTSDNQPWITVNPTGGSTTTGTDTVTVTINTAGLSVGTHTGTVTIGSNGGTKTGTISVTIPPSQADPQLCASPGHNFGTVQEGQTRTWTFEITNCGGGTLDWTVSDDHSWITVSPTGGTGTGTVTVRINTAGLSPGTHTGTVTVNSNGGKKTGTVSVNVQTSSPSPPPANVPAFTPIGMFAMVGLLGIAGMSAIRRK